MIDNRPRYLTDDPAYPAIPPLPIGLNLGTVPDGIKFSMLHLGGVQPLTGAMAEAAGFQLEDRPSAGELALYRQNQTRFQMISVVTSIAAFRKEGGVNVGVPYAISLVPASKRDVVSNVGVEYVEKIDLNVALQKQEPCYVDFNPFTGTWAAWGPVGLLLGEKPWATFPDGIGLVTDMYYLQHGFDPEDTLAVNFGIDDTKLWQKYHRHFTKLMFTPFEGLRARRVWGAESPIELFLLQALLRENLTPNLQMLFYEDGSNHPSIYDLWRQVDGETPGLITEADMYFPEERLAVFCDSTRHHRGRKAAQKDEAISKRLHAVGISSVRVPGSLIVKDLKAATKLVLDALEGLRPPSAPQGSGTGT
ncbi:hypothetical protein [Bosea psychrotolerans]|uniref:DUF559 domain-containing protein n=1 Tax=Bosea psychrotolerans TaxID=1871628 RepID=A0A2S4M3Y0_9HYPH|nr:hypothetical protein [Bosea psychrotolerans]POR49337.1 hypothetical protein CYD53_112162 [Bosea psychrotolerans]